MNSRLAHWAPAEPSLGWFKSFVQLAAATTLGREVEILQTLGDMDLGRPVTATVKCPHPKSMPASKRRYLEVDLDYLYDAEGTAFIKTTLEIESIRTVVEVGGLWTDRTFPTMTLLNNIPVRSCRLIYEPKP